MSFNLQTMSTPGQSGRGGRETRESRLTAPPRIFSALRGYGAAQGETICGKQRQLAPLCPGVDRRIEYGSICSHLFPPLQLSCS